MAFEGFPESGLRFLSDLADNNDREWWQANKKRYERDLLAPGKAFVAEVGDRLRSIRPAIQSEPKVNGAIFRMNRDTRFSKDKTPYKTHFDMMFFEGSGRTRECAGLFMRITPDVVMVGSGKHGFAGPELAAYRERVADDDKGGALVSAIAKAEERGYELGGSHYKRVPKDYPADHARAELLKHNALHVGREVAPPPPELQSAAFLDWTAAVLSDVVEIHGWVVDLVESLK